jgi:myo-inositol-1-phosphate synthase
VLLVGLGAVSTTTIAGVMAIRRGLAPPIGSLTQMGTIRLGKRTEGRAPKINEFVPLASLNDIVFGGWDIFEATRPRSSPIRPRPSRSMTTTS